MEIIEVNNGGRNLWLNMLMGVAKFLIIEKPKIIGVCERSIEASYLRAVNDEKKKREFIRGEAM